MLRRDKVGLYYDTEDPDLFNCECGYRFVVSKSVMSRALTCPKCYRAYLFQRHKRYSQVFKVEYKGRYKSKASFDQKLEDSAKKL